MYNVLSGLEPEYCEAEVCYIDDCNLKDVQWISCDVCSRWLHKYCCGLMEKANPKNFVISISLASQLN